MDSPILKGKLKFKEGRSKWKTRFIVIYRPVEFENHLQLYVLKSEEEFGKLCNGNSNKVVGTETEIGNNRPVSEPYDKIFGVEYGHRIDKNAHSIMLVGRFSVCFIGHSDFPNMISWSDRLQRELSDVYYHATLCEVSLVTGGDGAERKNGLVTRPTTSASGSSGSSSTSSASTSSVPGTAAVPPMQAGTLHIEKSRVCFVSEPASGSCKLIGSWDVRTVKHFATTPNDQFCLEVDDEEKKGCVAYTFKSHRVSEIQQDVQAVLSDRLPPSLLLRRGAPLASTSTAAMQIPPSGSRRSLRRRRRSREQASAAGEAPRASTVSHEGHLRPEDPPHRPAPSRRASVTTMSFGGSSSSCQPRRRHSNCVGNENCAGVVRPANCADGTDGRTSLSSADDSSSGCQQQRRLRGEDESNSAYTVFVPPARLSPTVVRRRDAELGPGSGGEPQRSVSFRLSSFVSRATFGTGSSQATAHAHEKRGSFLHRLIHKRRSRSDCDLGTDPAVIDGAGGGGPPVPEPSSLRLTMPPRSLGGCGPSSSSSAGSVGCPGGARCRNRVRPRPLPSPGVEDLRLFPGACRGAGCAHHPHALLRRPPQRSASGTELSSLPADYHEFYPAPCAPLRHSSTSLSLVAAAAGAGSGPCAGGQGLAGTSGAATSPAVTVSSATTCVNASPADVPLSPIREDLRASTSGVAGQVVVSASAPSTNPGTACSLRRTRTTSSSSGVSCGCGCGSASGGCGSSSTYGHLSRLPSTSSGSTAPSPPVQMRRCRLHTQTSTETSLGSLLPLESPPPTASDRSLPPGAGGDSTSAASSPDTQPPFLSESGEDQLDLSGPLRVLDSGLPHSVNAGALTSSSAPCSHAAAGGAAGGGPSGLRSTGDIPGCSGLAGTLHHYVNMTPHGSTAPPPPPPPPPSAAANPSLRDRELANTGYVNLDLRGEIHFSCPSAGGAGLEGVFTLPSTPASSARASLVLNEDSRSVNFAPLDLRPAHKMGLTEAAGAGSAGHGPARPLNYAQLQWLPNHRAPAPQAKPGHTTHGALGGEETEEEGAESEGKRDGYIEIDPVKTFAVNKVLADGRADEEAAEAPRHPKRHNSMKNGSTRRVPRFRFSSRKSYESTAAP